MELHTHFMLFKGVRAPNSPGVLRIDAYVASEPNSLASEAVPKYFFPAALAAASSPEVGLAPPPPTVDVGVCAGCDEDGGGGACDDGRHWE